MEKLLVILLALYAATVAALLAVHLYTPMTPSTVALVLLGLYAVTVIALLISRPSGERGLGLLVYLLAAAGLLAVLPLILFGAILLAAALLLLLPLAILIALLLR